MSAHLEDELIELRRQIATQRQLLQTCAAERDEAIAQVQAARYRQAASAEILRAIASAPGDAGRSLKLIAETSARLFGAPSVSIQMAEEDGAFTQEYRAGAIAQRIGSAYPRSHIRVGGRNMPGTVVAENRQIHIPDLDNLDPSMSDWPGLPHARAGGTRTLCGTPLRREGKAIGVLIVFRDRLLPFTDEELALQQTFADQAVIAIENARLFNETKEALERQTATANVLKVISRSVSDAAPVFEAILESCQRLFGLEAVAIYLVEGDLVKGVAQRGWSGGDWGRDATPLAGSSTGLAIAERRAVRFPHLADKVDLPEDKKARVRAAGGWTVLYAPMLSEERGIGSIVVSRKPAKPFTDKEIALVQSFADQAAIAIQNARLFEEVQARTRDLTEALERQTATSDILRVISSSTTDAKPVFDAIVLTAARLFGCQRAGVLRVDDGRLVAVTAASPERLIHPHELAPSMPIDPAANFPSRAVVSRKTLRCEYSAPDIPDHERYISNRYGIASALFLPLSRGEECVGVFLLTSDRSDAFDEKDVALAESFRDQALIAIENTRLFNETQEALKQQTATAEVLKVISRSAFDLDAVLDTLIESARTLCDAPQGMLLMRDGPVLRMTKQKGYPEAFERWVLDNPQPPGYYSGVGRAALTGEVVHFPDVEADPDYRLSEGQRLGGYSALLSVPLLRAQEVLGVFSLGRPNPGPFTDRQIELVRTFADQAVIAIENTRLFEQVQAKTRDLSEALVHQTASGNILKVIASSPTKVAPALQAIVESACEVCDAYDAAVILREGDHVRFSAHGGPIPIGLETWPLSRGWVGGRSIIDRAPVHVADLQLAGDEFPDGRDFALRMGHRTILAAPLMRESESIGAIVVRRKEAHPFSDKQIELLRTFADQAVIAIGNVRLFDEVQARTQDLTEALQQQTATAEVLQVISRSAFGLKTVLQTLVDSAVRLCASDGVIYLRHGEEFRAEAAFGADVAGRDPRNRSPRRAGRESVTGRVALSGRVEQIPDNRADPDFAVAAAQRMNMRALLGVPLLRDGEVEGVFVLGRPEPGLFGDRAVELVRTFADQAVIAIQNVRLFEAVQAKTRDLEESLRQQTATAEVLKVISRSAFDLQKVLDTLIGSAVTLGGADSGLIYLQRNDAFYVQAHYNPASETAFVEKLRGEPQRPGRTSVGARVLLTGEIQHVPDNRLDADYDPQLRAAAISRAVLGVPLKRDGVIVGAIALARREPGLFSDRQIELAKTFADQAVIAIENARLLDEVRARTRQLEESLEDLRKAQDRLVQSEKLASLGQLTAGIAHEIKNPLNFVNNFSTLSRELLDELTETIAIEPFEKSQRAEAEDLIGMVASNLDKVVTHGKRADSIVKNMLLHSREGSGALASVDINAMVEEALNLAYHGARAEKPDLKVTIDKSLDPNAGAAELFPQELTRVLLNLISNAFYATTKRGPSEADAAYRPAIMASTRDLGERIEIAIRDNGTGIPDDVKAKIFNPFFTTKPAGEGTGLGLSLSHDIVVKQHGGTLEVATEPGVYTQFTIVLPRASPSQEAARAQL
jgi:GAF domain-containing protein